MIGDKKYFLIMVIVLILISIGGAWASENHTDDAVAASDADQIAVDSGDDTGKDTSTVKENLTSQKNDEAVKAADSQSNQKGEILSASNDEDVLGATAWPSSNPTNWRTDYEASDVILTSGTFYGNGHYISGLNNNRIFTIGSSDASTGTVTFNNITFKEGKNSNMGGLIYVSAKMTVIFNHCTFEGSNSNVGGAIYSKGGTIELNDCKFENCYSYNTMGGAIYSKGTLTINRCSFENCHSQTMGGVIYSIENQFVISNSVFKNNYAGTIGGCIVLASGKQGSYIDNCRFEYNNATTNHAAVAISAFKGTSFSLTNSNFTGNKATTRVGSIAFYDAPNIVCQIENCRFENNVAENDRTGALDLNGVSSATVKNCVFINNTASKNNGGAICIPTAVSTLTVINSNFTDNKATTGNGGAIYSVNGLTSLTINNCNFTGNNATSGSGGAIYFTASSDNILINNTKFDKNNAVNGGAIQFYASTEDGNDFENIDIIKSNFTNNKASADGSAINLIDVKDVDFDNCLFDSNVADGNGALKYHKFSDIYYNNCKFINNNASYGGALYYAGMKNYAGNSTYVKCLFDNNFASSNAGAIYTLGNNVTIRNTDFTNNHANVWAGGIQMGERNSGFETTGLNIYDSTFINNTAGDSAGAIDAFDTDYVFITDSTFKTNNATRYGGAVYLTGDYGVITKSIFIANKAAEGSAISYYPQATTVVDPTMGNITYCKFEDNVATTGGTVWFRSSQGNILYCNFTDNTAPKAGAVYVDIDGVTIDHNRFIGNNATAGDGGAIYIVDLSTVNNTIIKNSLFTNNYASGNGGAVYDAAKQDTITNCNFTKNHADVDGGAIYFLSNGGSISYCNFTNNSATNGGAVVLANNNQKISNCNFNDNNAAIGGAVYALDKTTLNITDSTFKSNEAYIYLHRLTNNPDMARKMEGLKMFIISEENMKKLNRGLSYADYFEFYDEVFDRIGKLEFNEGLLDGPDVEIQDPDDLYEMEREAKDDIEDDNDNFIF